MGSSTRSQYPCQSWEVQAYAPTNATCRLFADSLFRTSPLGGYYSTHRGVCPTAPWPHSTYGLVAQASSVLNCGRTPRPSPAKGGTGGGGGDGGLPANGVAKPPAPAATPIAAVEGRANPSPRNHDSDSAAGSATGSAMMVLGAAVLGLLVL